MTDTIGRRIAQQRRMAGLSQEALGDKLGVSRQAISKWESDVCIPEVEKLIAMSKIFGVSVDELLGVEASAPSDETSSEDSQAEAAQFFQAFQMTSASSESAPQAESESPPPAEQKQAHSRTRWLPLMCVVLAVFSILLSIISLSRARQPAEDTGTDAELLSRLEEMEQELTALHERDKELDDTDLHLMIISNGTSGDIRELQRDVEALFVAIETVPQKEAQEQATYDSLSSWSLNGVAAADLSCVKLTFQCVSATQTNGARLAVWRDGEELTSFECSGDGDGYEAQFELPAENGYQYVLHLTHMDGGAERIVLDGHGLSDLKELTEIQLRLVAQDVTVDSQNQDRFWIGFNKVVLIAPELVAEDAQLLWSDLTVRCYQNELLVDEFNIAEDFTVLDDADMTRSVLSFRVPMMTFKPDLLLERDNIRLYMEGVLTVDGQDTALSFLLEDWNVENGKFISNLQ